MKVILKESSTDFGVMPFATLTKIVRKEQEIVNQMEVHDYEEAADMFIEWIAEHPEDDSYMFDKFVGGEESSPEYERKMLAEYLKDNHSYSEEFLSGRYILKIDVKEPEEDDIDDDEEWMDSKGGRHKF